MNTTYLKDSLKGFVLLTVVVGAVACGEGSNGNQPGNSFTAYDLALGLENQGSTCYANAALTLLSKHPGTQACVARHGGAAVRAAFHRLMRPLQTNYALIADSNRFTPSRDFYRQEIRTLFGAFGLQARMGHGQADSTEFLSEFLPDLGCDEDFISFQRNHLTNLLPGGDNFELGAHPGLMGIVDPYFLPVDVRNHAHVNIPTVSEAVQGHLAEVHNVLPILISTAHQPSHLLVRLKRLIEFPAPPVRLNHSVEITDIRVPYYPMNYVGAPHAADDVFGGLLPIAPERQAPLADHQLHIQHVDMHPAAVICHSGNATSGHYYAYTRSQELNAWVKHDDKKVTPMGNGNLPRQAKDDMDHNAIVVLYVR